MTDTYSTSSTLDNLLTTYLAKKALPTLINNVQFYRFADKTPLPKGAGNIVRWNAWKRLTKVSAALTEGTTPGAGESLSSRKVSATLAQYGDIVIITDFIDYTSSLDAIKGGMEMINDQAAESLDSFMLTAIFKNDFAANGGTTEARILSGWVSGLASGFHAGSHASAASSEAWGFPVIFAGTATRLSATNRLAPSTSAAAGVYAIREATKELDGKNARRFPDGTYVGICNSDFFNDLMRDPGFADWMKYTSNRYGVGAANLQMDKPIVEVAGVKFYADNNIPKYRANHSCDLTFIFGPGAYGVTEFDNGAKGFNVYITRPGSQSMSDPLRQRTILGWKTNVAVAALNVSCGRTLITHSKKN